MLKELVEKRDKIALFGLRPPEGGRRAAFWLWNGLWLLAAGAGLAVCSLLLATGGYPHNIAFGYFERPLIWLLNLLPVLVLLALLYFAVGRGWLAFLLTAGVTLGFSAANYFKLLFRDDPVMFADLLLLKEAGKISGQYNMALDWELLFCIAAAAGGTIFLALFVRGRPRGWVRPCGALAAVLAGALLAPAYLSENVYNDTAHYARLDNQWSSTQQYISRGFLYPFLHSVTEAIPTPPEGYSEQEAAALLAGYSDADIPEGEKVNVIAIMLEAFSDFSKYPQIEFASDVYGLYHELAAESYTGALTTNIFAGGTLISEQAFLTGYSNLDNYRSYTNSHVWYFKSQGYQTRGDHPCYGWFYNRQNVNPYLGFDSYRFVEDHYGQFTGGGVAPDDIFFPELLASCEEAMAEEAPLFSFSVSYQGHGPYDSTVYNWGGPGTFVAAGTYTEEAHCILENYFGSVADTLENLDAFVDSLRENGEPVVLVVFGDHNPWMGDGNSVYEELGISFDMSAAEGFRNYYDTPYLIWANDAAKEAVGFDFVGEGPNLGPYFLMSHLFDLCGWEGSAFMQASRETAQAVSVIGETGRYVEGGVLTDALLPESAALVERYTDMQYYWSRNFQYSALIG